MKDERQPFCKTCRFYEILRFTERGQPAEAPGCWHHIRLFPNAYDCARYEREPGSD